MFILMYTHLPKKNRKFKFKMIIRDMGVLIYGPF
jgi:hypothetical protein